MDIHGAAAQGRREFLIAVQCTLDGFAAAAVVLCVRYIEKNPLLCYQHESM
jgi:hypothetical protein